MHFIPMKSLVCFQGFLKQAIRKHQETMFLHQQKYWMLGNPSPPYLGHPIPTSFEKHQPRKTGDLRVPEKMSVGGSIISDFFIFESVSEYSVAIAMKLPTQLGEGSNGVESSSKKTYHLNLVHMFLGALCCGTPMGAMSRLWGSQLFLQIHDAQNLET